jgi:hypothetical protein
MKELSPTLQSKRGIRKPFCLERLAAAQTYFLKELSLTMHAHYQGKMQPLPKAGIWV